jgi:hypothetical protein
VSLRRPSKRARLACGVGVVVAGLPLAGCSEVESESSTGYEPAKLKAVNEHGDLQRVIFTAEGARRIGLRTARVRRSAKRTVVPYTALLYDPEGKTYVYTSPRALVYVRAEVQVRRIDGARALLSDGPPAGTEVVTVGATEVYGTELEVPSH